MAMPSSPSFSRWSLLAVSLVSVGACNGMFGVSDLTYDGGVEVGGGGAASSSSSAGGMGGTSAEGGASSSSAGGMGGAGGAMMFLDVAAPLDGLRLEIPCGPSNNVPGFCGSMAMLSQQVLLAGRSDVDYLIELRVRGVVEEKTYLGPMAQGFLSEGGQPADDNWNTIGLFVNNAQQAYYLNAGVSGASHCVALDYTFSFVASGAEQLRLSMEDVNALQALNEDQNGEPIVIPDIPPAPNAYDGQFVQLDVISVTLN